VCARIAGGPNPRRRPRGGSDTLAVPMLHVLAPKGMLGQPPGLLRAQAVADAHRRPDIRVETIADANHSTLHLDLRYAATVARGITTHKLAATLTPRDAFPHLGRHFISDGSADGNRTRFRYISVAG
jgi:hypothetical protein